MEERNMNVTKFGVSAAFLSAIAYFAGYIGIVPVILLLIFALYTDADVVFKKNVAQATLVSVVFTIIITVLSACSSGYLSFISLFSDAYKVYSVLSKLDLCNWLNVIVKILEFVVMVYGVIAGFKGNVVKLPIVTKMVAKHFGEEPEQKAAGTEA